MPEQVLDMNIPMLQACIEGYQERLFDEQILAVHQGYWAGYYQSKKPKSANVIISKMIQNKEKSKNKRNPNAPKPEVDLDTFMRREKRRIEYIASQKRR